jgi:hypothetical protein
MLGLVFAVRVTVRLVVLIWLWRLHQHSVSGTDDDCTKSIPEADLSRPWVPPNEVPGAEAYIPVVRGYVVLS